LASLGDLRAIVLDNLERAASDSNLQSSNADRWINNVIRKTFCTRYNWDAMEATYSINCVANQEMYPFPSPQTKDIKQIAVRLSSGSPYMPLREDSEDQLDHNIPLTVIPGVPKGWCRAGTSIRLRPAPGTSASRIRARVWDYPTPLTDPSATNYWTMQHDDLIEDMATALGYRWLGDFERYGAIWQASMQELQTRIADDMKRLRPARQTVSPSLRAGKPSSSVGPRIGEDGYYRQYSP
jgi:hypothetical protein